MSASSAASALSGAAALYDRLGRLVFRYRDYLAPVMLIIAVLLARPHAPWGSERWDLRMDVLGFVVAALGQALRMTVIGYAYIVRGGAKKEIAAPRLVREGFYAHCRNPMYMGNFLLLTGLALIYSAAVVYVVLLPICIVSLLAIVKAEERFLSQRFGTEYAEYCRRVPRFVPRLRGLRATMASMRFDWRRMLRKEYGTTLAWLSSAFGLMAWERIVRLGWAASVPDLRVLALLYAPIPVAWVIVRLLKKTGRLKSPG
ncbi:MAG: isoprenylcysteine carboxylmethyltransferase family protein [Candidatus Binatia bacterium]